MQIELERTCISCTKQIQKFDKFPRVNRIVEALVHLQCDFLMCDGGIGHEVIVTPLLEMNKVKTSPLFELATVLVHSDHIASPIVNANHDIMWAASRFSVIACDPARRLTLFRLHLAKG